jgi:ferritin
MTWAEQFFCRWTQEKEPQENLLKEFQNKVDEAVVLKQIEKFEEYMELNRKCYQWTQEKRDAIGKILTTRHQQKKIREKYKF